MGRPSIRHTDKDGESKSCEAVTIQDSRTTSIAFAKAMATILFSISYLINFPISLRSSTTLLTKLDILVQPQSSIFQGSVLIESLDHDMIRIKFGHRSDPDR